jgi:hypothetical protein
VTCYNGKFQPPVGAVEIILQGAFKQVGDLVGIVAERSTSPGSKHDPANLILPALRGSVTGLGGQSGTV